MKCNPNDPIFIEVPADVPNRTVLKSNIPIRMEVARTFLAGMNKSSWNDQRWNNEMKEAFAKADDFIRIHNETCGG